jgi:predicted transcriptional regulator
MIETIITKIKIGATLSNAELALVFTEVFKKTEKLQEEINKLKDKVNDIERISKNRPRVDRET